ncbi:hypothetical protein K0M31_016625, partial [Melipona bicolor]
MTGLLDSGRVSFPTSTPPEIQPEDRSCQRRPLSMRLSSLETPDFRKDSRKDGPSAFFARKDHLLSGRGEAFQFEYLTTVL